MCIFPGILTFMQHTHADCDGKQIRNTNENALLSKIRVGDKEAFVELFGLYRARILGMAKSFARSDGEIEDLVQEGSLALYTAALAYDNSSSKFSTFAQLCMRRKMLNWLEKSHNAEWRSISVSELSDEELARRGGVQDTFEDDVAAQASLEELFALAQSVLSPLEYRVLLLYARGYGSTAIANKLSLSVKSCENALYRMRVKLRSVRE